MTPKYFDAHTHLNMQFENDWREVGKRAIENGVWFVNVGADLVSSQKAIEQAEYLGDQGFATVGLHPTENKAEDFSKIVELAKNRHVVAIGECGLEYFRLPDSAKSSVVAKQRELFKKHIELALELDKPLMIHCRSSAHNNSDAYNDVWEILKSYLPYFAKASQSKQKLRFCLHFFVGNWALAQKFLDMGGYLSFTGVITFADQYDEVITKMSLDRIMAETDAPFVAPVPYRGQRNEPAYIQFVAERIADLRPEPREEVLTVLVQNAKRFYNLP